MAVCDVCFRHCALREGERGFCGARVCREGRVLPAAYGAVTALALDPIEKKPLARFHPGSRILSVGSSGCNLRCPFCQNWEISWSREAEELLDRAQRVTPRELADAAAACRARGNIGLAFTYNEPLVGYEFVRDTAALSHGMGMKNVLVTNGTAELPVLEELLPCIDAMNIDLKGFTETYYEKLGGDLQTVLAFIERAAADCHVELTCLIVPGENDTEEEMRRLAGWAAGLGGGPGPGGGRGAVPLHISRFFPAFRMQDRGSTEVSLIYRLAEVAREQLAYVYTGNC